MGAPIKRAVKGTHCRKRGHELTPENCIWHRDPGAIDGRSRQCRICKNDGARVLRKIKVIERHGETVSK